MNPKPSLWQRLKEVCIALMHPIRTWRYFKDGSG